jgi:hypothetical protein
LLLGLTSVSVSGCNRVPADQSRTHPIVGTWIVEDPNAPFPYHLYVFARDGTMHQANPDAGDPRTSDSDGKGVWEPTGDHVQAKWVELTADRATHRYAGRLEFTMKISVTGDSLTAQESVSVFDATGASSSAPATPKPLRGARVVIR